MTDTDPSLRHHAAAEVDHPEFRLLRVFAFDPSLAFDRGTAHFAQATVRLPWEQPFDKSLEVGPSNDYFEVIDVDPASGLAYPPVDLNNKWLLATDGHAPSESNPQFHQQQAFAVAMRTIGSFERALGRRVLWGEHRHPDFKGGAAFDRVRQLRVYPHALRDENAFYSPGKVALLFGYFQAGSGDDESIPGSWIFGCLSQDIVAHETTHAILDGLNRFYIEDSQQDALAFHEALADIVALLQHFTFPEAVSATIASAPTMGAASLLSGLARQFGRATQRRGEGLPPGPLRDAVGKYVPATANTLDTSPQVLADVTDDCHARGQVLVSAVYAAFSEVYAARARDLLALATGRTSVDPDIALHPAIVARLTTEAVELAGRVLSMCLRAIDYLPPVSVTFGDFLRAVVTGDRDLFPADDLGIRQAIIAGFRRYGIYPAGVRSLAEDSLLWPRSTRPLREPVPHGLNFDAIFARDEICRQENENSQHLWEWLNPEGEVALDFAAFIADIGLSIGDLVPPSVFRRGDKPGPDGSFVLSTHNPSIEIHHCRLSRRTGSDGQSQRLLTVQISQRRRGYALRNVQHDVDTNSQPGTVMPAHDFVMRGGCTLVFDLMGVVQHSTRLTNVRYKITQPIAGKEGDARLEAMRVYQFGAPMADGASAFQALTGTVAEPFAALHRL